MSIRLEFRNVEFILLNYIYSVVIIMIAMVETQDDIQRRIDRAGEHLHRAYEDDPEGCKRAVEQLELSIHAEHADWWEIHEQAEREAIHALRDEVYVG